MGSEHCPYSYQSRSFSLGRKIFGNAALVYPRQWQTCKQNFHMYFVSIDWLGTHICDNYKPSLLAVVRVNSFAITFSNILAPSITAWREIFVVFDYMEYQLAKNSNRQLSFCYFSSMNAYENGRNCIHLRLLDTVD